MTKIKICGLMTDKDAKIVNATQPDFAGVVFAAGRHQVSAQQAAHLRHQIDASIPLVGVFVDSSLNEIKALFDQNIIQVAQLHGNESETMVASLTALHIPTIQVFKPQQNTVEDTHADYYMLDSGNGSGKTLDWAHLSPINPTKVFLAGGLNPRNVEQAIQAVHPYAVDVSSGVEVNGHKDLQLVEQMVTIAHQN